MGTDERGGAARINGLAAGTFRRRGAPPGRRRRKVYLVLGCMLALAGAIFAWLLLPEPFREPQFLTVSLTEYDDPRIPVNAFGGQDSEFMLTPFTTPDGPKPTRAFGSQTREALLNEVEALRGEKDRPVVVHLCAQARADADEVYLLPGNARLDVPADALPLSKFLQALADCPAPHKLLLLDVMRPLADPFAGVLVSDVAARVPALVEKANAQAKGPKLLVLAACSLGQWSLTSEELGRSVFAYYVELGLRGWADGYPQAKPDGRVSVRELTAFVRDRVDRWASLNTGTRQTPVLFGDDNFDLVLCDRDRAAPADPLPEPPKYPEWLSDAWQQRDDRAAEGGRLLPRGLRQLEARLLRAEQRWRGGVDKDIVSKDVKEAVTEYANQLDAARRSVPRPAEPRSLALLARAQNFKPETSGAVARLLDDLGQPPPVANKPLREPWEIAVKARMKELKDKYKDNPAELAWLLVEGLAGETALGTDKLTFLNEQLPSLVPAAGFVETECLFRLARLRKELDPAKEWPDKAASRDLRAVRTGEVAANADPRVLGVARDAVRAAADKRRQGEALLDDVVRNGKRSKLAAAEQFLKAAEDRVQEVLPLQRALVTAYDTRDEALALLPACVPYLAGRPDDAAGYEEWQRGRRWTTELCQLLDSVPAAALDDLEAQARRLQAPLEELRQPFAETNVKKLIAASRPADARPDLIGRMNLLLESPGLKKKEREDLWTARRDLARRLHEEAARHDREDDPARRPPKALEVQGDAERVEHRRAWQRAQLATELLWLEPWPDEERARLTAALDGARDEKGGRKAWEDLGRELRLAWVEQLPGHLEGKALLAADRTSRILLPANGGRRSEAGGAEEPTLLLRRAEAAALWKWLADSYKAEARAATDSRAFYQKAADSYRLAAP